MAVAGNGGVRGVSRDTAVHGDCIGELPVAIVGGFFNEPEVAPISFSTLHQAQSNSPPTSLAAGRSAKAAYGRCSYKRRAPQAIGVAVRMR